MAEEPIVELTKEDLDSKKEENSKMIVDFWAEWCGACERMKPIFDSLAEDYQEEILFGSVDVGENREIAKEYDVSSIPTFVFFKDGEIMDKIVGTFPREELEEKIEKM